MRHSRPRTNQRQEGYFEFTKGDTKGFYFIKEKSTVSRRLQQIWNWRRRQHFFRERRQIRRSEQKSEIVIPGEYELILWDSENYNAAKNKNDKRPYFDAKTKRFNWYLAEAAVFDADGKLVKKLTAPQAKKFLKQKIDGFKTLITHSLSGRRCFYFVRFRQQNPIYKFFNRKSETVHIRQ